MKKTALALALIILISCQNENKEQLEFSGTIDGLKQGTLTIKKIVDTTFIAIDTIIFDGKSTFETSFELKNPEVLYLFLDRGKTESIDNSVMFFAEPGKVNLQTTLEKFYADAKFSGSKHQEIYQEYLTMKRKFTEKNIEYLNVELQAKGNINSDSINQLRIKNDKRRTLYTLNFAKTNKDSHVAPFVVISDVNATQLSYLKEVYQALNPEIAKGQYGKSLKKIIDEIEKSAIK